MPQDDVTTVFSADITDFKSAMQEASRQIRLANSEFNALATAMDDTADEQDKLNLQVERATKVRDAEAKKLKALQEEYQKVAKEQGENSKGAEELKIKVNQQQAAFNKAEKSLAGYEEQLNDIDEESKDATKSTDDFADSGSKVGKTFNGFGKLAGAVAAGLVAIGAAAVAGAKKFLDLAESTREYRTEMAKLKSINDEMNADFKETKKTYQELVAITNDEGAATEAVNNLLTAGFKGDELDEVSNYLQGAAIKWKDTLKAEGLADSIQEWIGTGGESLTGQMAELLERLGYNLDVVKVETAGMTEAQRRAYLMNILSAEGLGEITEAYKKENKTIYEASMAQQNLNDKLAVLGDAAEPIVTLLKNDFAKVLEYITPWVTRLANAFELLLSKGNEMTGLQRLADIFLDFKEKASELLVSIVNGLAEAIPQFLPKVAEFLGQVVQQFVEFIPTLTNAAIQLFLAIAEAIPPTITALIEQLPQILDSVVAALNEMIPALLECSIQFLSTIVDALPAVINKLVEALPQIIETISNFVQENLPVVLDGFITLLNTIIEALPIVIESLIEALPTIIETIVKFLTDNIPVILDGAIKLLMVIVDAIPVIIEALLKELPTIITTILVTLAENMPKIWAMGFELFMQIVKAIPDMIIHLGEALGNITDTIFETLEDIDLFEIGQQILQGLIDGMLDIGKNIWGAITSIGDNIVSGFKSFFGIHSPSKLMHDQIGEYLGEGIVDGIEDGFDKDIDSVKKSMLSNLDIDGPTITTRGNSGSASSQQSASSNGKVVNVYYNVTTPKPINRAELWNQSKRLNKVIQGVI
jgi:ABC-type transporter Mla subunit MlaD